MDKTKTDDARKHIPWRYFMCFVNIQPFSLKLI